MFAAFFRDFIYTSIRGIRTFFGPPGYCKFEPSCSHFAIQQLQEHSLLPALGAITVRLIRCSPLSRWL